MPATTSMMHHRAERVSGEMSRLTFLSLHWIQTTALVNSLLLRSKLTRDKRGLQLKPLFPLQTCGHPRACWSTVGLGMTSASAMMSLLRHFPNKLPVAVVESSKKLSSLLHIFSPSAAIFHGAGAPGADVTSSFALGDDIHSRTVLAAAPPVESWLGSPSRHPHGQK